MIVLGGGMHPDEEEQHAWLGPELRWLAGLLEARNARARRLPRLAAPRPGRGRRGLPRARAGGGLAPGRTHRGGRRRSGRPARCRSGSTPSSGTTTRTSCRTGPSSSRAARSACRPTGSGTPRSSSSTRRCARTQVEAWLAEEPDDVTEPEVSARRDAYADRCLERARALSVLRVRRHGVVGRHAARYSAHESVLGSKTSRLALAPKPPRHCTFLFVCHIWPERSRKLVRAACPARRTEGASHACDHSPL